MADRENVSDDDLARYRRNFAAEVDGVELYRLLAEAEESPALKTLYGRLAEAEVRHRDLWAERIKAAGHALPKAKPSFRVRTLGWLARRFGTGLVAPIVMRLEMADTGMYDEQPEAVAAGLPNDERSHARVFQQLAKGRHRDDAASQIARIEGRHRLASGNALRAGVLGVNDGLTSTLILVMGVAGADPAAVSSFSPGSPDCSPAPSPWLSASGLACAVPPRPSSASLKLNAMKSR